MDERARVLWNLGFRGERANRPFGDPTKPIFIHVPRTSGTSICETMGLYDCHIPASIRSRCETDWNSRFKFTVIRNPWFQARSFFFLRHYHLDGSFDDWALRKDFDSPPLHGVHPLDQMGFFCDRKGKSLVDKVIKYEDLTSQYRWKALLAKCGLPDGTMRAPDTRQRTVKVYPEIQELMSKKAAFIILERNADFCRKYNYTIPEVFNK